MKRRTLLLGAAAAAAGGLTVGYAAVAARGAGMGAPAAVAGETALAGWLRIAEDDTVTVIVPHADMGQGIPTALAMMLAEELDCDWARVRTEQAPGDAAFANRFLARGWVLGNRAIPALFDGVVDTVFGSIAGFMQLQITGGSTAVRMTGQTGMRVTGALARQLLLQAAAARWQLPAAELRSAEGRVLHPASGRSLRYGELAADAARLPLPARPVLKRPQDFRLIGTSPPRLDIPAKVDGRARYGIDVQLPGMRYAAVRAAPVHGEQLLGVDPAPALAVPGVEQVVQLADAVAVVARRYWTAHKALALLQPRFGGEGSGRGLDSAGLFAAQARALAEDDGDDRVVEGSTEEVLGRAGMRHVEALYRVPFLHHAAMEPINATAQLSDGRLSFWGAAQNLLQTRSRLAELAGLPADRVLAHPMAIGGSFGRRVAADRVPDLPQLVRVAQAAAPHPVKLLWSREEDFAQGCYRPALSSRLQGSLGTDGLPEAWAQRFIDAPGRNEAFGLPYRIPHQTIESVPARHHVRTGSWRSVAHTQHGFYTESFIDELAHGAGRDPVAYRRALLPPGSRLRRVLDEAAARAGWTTPAPAGQARGVAVVESFGTAVAQVVEVTLGADGLPRVLRVTAAVDCGRVIHPDTARQQVEGAILMGLGAALGEQITIADGAVVQRNFPDYPLLRMAQTPQLDIHFLASPGPLGGLGEPGLPPVAPALANAVFALTGRRIRSLPLLAGWSPPPQALQEPPAGARG